MANFNDLKKKYYELLAPLQQGLSNIGKDVSQNVAKGAQVVQQNVGNAANQANYNLWHSPIGQGAINIQKGAADVQNFIQSSKQTTIVPTLTPLKDRSLTSQIGNTVANLPGQIVNSVVGHGVIDPALDFGRVAGNTLIGQELPQYKDLKSGVARLGYESAGVLNPSRKKALGINDNIQNTLGNIADTALPIATAYTPKGATNIVEKGFEQVGKQGFKQAVKQGALTAANLGGIFGVLSGLAEGRNDSLRGQLTKAGTQGVTGYGTGLVAGGVLSAGSYGAGKLFNEIKSAIKSEHPQANEAQTNELTKEYIRDRVGRFAKGEGSDQMPLVAGMSDKPLDRSKPFEVNDWKTKVDQKLGIDKITTAVDNMPQPGLSIKMVDSKKKVTPIDKYGEILDKGIPSSRKYTDKGLKNPQLEEGVGSTILKNTPQTPKELQEQPRIDLSSTLPGGRSLEQSGQGEILPQAPGQGNSSGGSIAQVPNSENPYFNTNKLNVSPEAKQQVNKVIQEVKPEIEKVVGKKLSNAEVIQTAENSSKVLNSVVDRSQTEEYIAKLLKTRQKLAASAQSGKVDQEYINNLIEVKSHATDIARKLQSFNIGADPKTVTSRDAILDAVLKVEKDTNKVIKAADGVDFNDLKQSTDFYRQFIKPSVGEWTDLVRYNSMLSSPNTHINNAASNVVNTSVVAPVEKTLTGTLDFLSSKVTGKNQTQFAGEGAQYAKGYATSIHEAAHAFADSLRGKTVTGNLDARQIPLSTDKRISNLNLPTRLLEASDQFFTALTKGGETAALNYRKGKGVNVGNIETQAMDNAKYRLFRSELFDKRQGGLLSGIDHITNLIQRARNIKAADNATAGEKMGAKLVSTIAKFTLPFVQTPMNILKQGIEYSPFGFGTIPGAANKTEQVSKALLGTAGMSATMMMVASGRSTWTEPTDPTKRAAFRSAGLQPYSVKIGDKWVSYAKLPPALGFPLAFTSALHDAEQNKTIDQSQLNVILGTVAKMGNFYADQSYVKNIGDMVAAAKGSTEDMTRFISNYPQQLVPYRALLGWMARLTDPYQRKVNQDTGFLEKQVQQLFTQIPGLSQTVPARLDKAGEPIPNQNKEINAFSPLRVTSERPQQKEYYDLLKQKALNTKNTNIIKEKIKAGEDVTLPTASAAETTPTGNTMADKLRADMEDDMNREKAKMSNKAIVTRNKVYYVDRNGDGATVDLSPKQNAAKPGSLESFDEGEKNATKARDIYKISSSQLPENEKNKLIKQLGYDPKDVEYDNKAQFNNDAKTKYILNQKLDHNTLISRLETGRVKSIGGNYFASDGVLDNLYNDGAISYAERKYLKSLKLDKDMKVLAGSGGTGKGRKGRKAKFVKLVIPKARPIKLKSRALKRVKEYKLSTNKKIKGTKIKLVKTLTRT